MTQTKNLVPILLAAVICVVVTMFTQCSLRDEQSVFFRVPHDGWPYDSAYSYIPADSVKAVQTANLAIAVRHTNGYEYSNLYVELAYTLGDSAARVDTFNLRLADDYGHWYGKGMGVGFQFVDTVLRHVPINLSKPITLRHVMRADTLQHIEQVGIIVNP